MFKCWNKWVGSKRSKNKKFKFYENKEDFYFGKMLIFLSAIKLCVFYNISRMKNKVQNNLIWNWPFPRKTICFVHFFDEYSSKKYRIYFFLLNFAKINIKIIFSEKEILLRERDKILVVRQARLRFL
jgi:hypothetical protein